MKRTRYRVWRWDTEQWENGKCFLMPDGRVVDTDQRNLSDKRIDLCESTGIFDKNGDEIYDGDVVKGWWRNTENIPEYGIVYWNDKTAGFFVHWKPYGAISGMSSFFCNSEIIGNIFEHSWFV